MCKIQELLVYSCHLTISVRPRLIGRQSVSVYWCPPGAPMKQRNLNKILPKGPDTQSVYLAEIVAFIGPYSFT